MKIAGVKLDGPSVEIIPIVRGEQEIILKAQAVLDYDEFYKICPMPQPPEIIKPGPVKVQDPNNPAFLKKRDEYAKLKFAWMFIKSLEATDGLEWETIDMSKPETWLEYENELKSAGFTEAEVLRISMGVMNAQGLNNEKVEEARKRFLAGPGPESKDS